MFGRNRLLVTRGFKPKDAAEIVLQEIALEHRNNEAKMKKAQTDAEEFLRRVRSGLGREDATEWRLRPYKPGARLQFGLGALNAKGGWARTQIVRLANTFGPCKCSGRHYRRDTQEQTSTRSSASAFKLISHQPHIRAF
jgi:hypothetical protein